MEFALPLARSEPSRAPPKDEETVPDIGEAFPLSVVIIVLGGLFCIFLGCDAGIETTQDGALLEGVLDGAPMIGARLLQHLVEETGPSRSPLGVLAICRSDEVVVRPALLPLATLFLLFRVLGA